MMSRRIVTHQPQLQAAQAGGVDTYFDKVVKFIPADIVAAWVAAAGIIAGAGEDVPVATIYWIAFGVGLLITPLWTLRQTALPGLKPAYVQAGVATGAFAVWVFALGGPFASLDIYKPLYGSLLLILYTLVVGLIKPA